MSGEELYNADVAKDPTFLDGKPRPTWERLGPIFRKSWEQKATELTPPCDFCGKPGHADTPCPVRHESAVRHAEEGSKAYPPATGIEAMVCREVTEAMERWQIAYENGATICREIAARQRLGVQKYGTTLADNPATLRERLRHALEESLDLAVYAQWAMDSDEASKLLPMLAGLRTVALESACLLLDTMATTEGGQP